jgi:UDP-N-acetylglucosamine diphosphorylase/glucosamine-1-phosphate N-acetyltransferase
MGSISIYQLLCSMAIILFDNRYRRGLYPFTLTRAVADLRFGIFSVKERWERVSGQPVWVATEPYLQALYPVIPEGVYTWVDASVIGDAELYKKILSLEKGSCIVDEKGLIAGRTEQHLPLSADNLSSAFAQVNDHAPVQRLIHPWQMMQWNDAQIRSDVSLLTKNRTSQPIPETVQAVQPDQIFIEEGARLSFCILNAATGPIYIGKNAEIMEGSVVRGPFVLGDNSVLKMNSRVYGATTLGPSCMGGGEIKNTVMMGYSNKAHDGYLGDAVIGEWCNFGAGSTNSNIKNTAGEVKVWDMGAEKYVGVGQKCGVIMGDYTRVAINSSINTGSMIGVSSNVFGAGLLPTIIPNFAWGIKGTRYEPQKAFEAIANWKRLKGANLSHSEIAVLQYIFDHY